MLSSHSGFVKRRRRGAVVIMAPLSSTALESSGEIWTSWSMVWVRTWWWSGGGEWQWMIVEIGGRGIDCGVGVGMAWVFCCTRCGGGVGLVRIAGRRAIGCSCLWPLPVSSASGKCCCGTTVDMARLGSCCVCWDCCRSGLLGEVHELIYHRVRDSVRTGGDRWLGRGWPCRVCW